MLALSCSLCLPLRQDSLGYLRSPRTWHHALRALEKILDLTKLVQNLRRPKIGKGKLHDDLGWCEIAISLSTGSTALEATATA